MHNQWQTGWAAGIPRLDISVINCVLCSLCIFEANLTRRNMRTLQLAFEATMGQQPPGGSSVADSEHCDGFALCVALKSRTYPAIELLSMS